VANLFVAAVVAVLAHSASDYASSGVLNVIANYRLPVVASAGESALLSPVQRYRLGEVVSPDATSPLTKAFCSILANPLSPNWQGYHSAINWSANARHVLAEMGLRRSDA